MTRAMWTSCSRVAGMVKATGTTVPAVPNYHTDRRTWRVPKGVIGKLGYYSPTRPVRS